MSIKNGNELKAMSSSSKMCVQQQDVEKTEEKKLQHKNNRDKRANKAAKRTQKCLKFQLCIYASPLLYDGNHEQR